MEESTILLDYVMLAVHINAWEQLPFCMSIKVHHVIFIATVSPPNVSAEVEQLAQSQSDLLNRPGAVFF